MKNGLFLQNKGGYRNLRVYQITEIIYDVTYYFTQQYLDKRDRTVDQMIQQHVPANRILPKEAKHPQHLQKQKLS